MNWRTTWVWLSLVIILAAAFRLWQIDAIPPGFHFDESFEGLEAWRILTDPGYRPIFLTGNFGVGPVNSYANAVMFGLFSLFGGEAGPTAMRTTAALFGVLGVLAVWAAARELQHRESGSLTTAFPLFAAALLATMRWHIHFSRIGIEPIIVAFETALALWLLMLASRTGSRSAWAGCGVVLALGVYTYQGAWVLPPAIALIWGILWWYTPRGEARSRMWIGGVIAAVTAIVLLLPLALFFMQNSALLILRPAQIATTGTEAATHQSLGESVLAYSLMFVPLVQAGDLDPRRNIPGLAALNVWQAIPFWLGVGLAFWRIRRPAYSILLLLTAVMLLPGVLSEYAPHYHRVLGAAAPVALLGGIGLDAVWRLWGERRTAAVTPASPRRRLPAWAGWLSVVLLAAGAIVSARDYFVRWAALPDLFYAFDAGLWTIGQTIAAQPGDAAVYLSPRRADHPTLAFAWTTRKNGHGPPVTYDGRYVFPLAAGATQKPEQYIAIEDEDFRTRLLLPELFPDAEVTDEVKDLAGKAYARTYTRPAGSLPQRAPSVAAPLEVGDGIRLAGYDVQTAVLETGRILYVQLYWDVNAAPARDWTVFVHLLGADDAGNASLMAGVDSLPGAGSLPTVRWQPGWRVLDEYQIALPADLAPGDYTLSIGLYDDQGNRLPGDGSELTIGEVTLD